MHKYELYFNKELEVFVIYDEGCSEIGNNPNLELVDSIETETSIHGAFKRYILAYPQRKVVIADCCKRK